MKDITHDLTFYCTHNQLCVPQYKVNVGILGMYNFGIQVNNFQKFPFVCHFIREFAHFDRMRRDKIFSPRSHWEFQNLVRKRFCSKKLPNFRPIRLRMKQKIGIEKCSRFAFWTSRSHWDFKTWLEKVPVAKSYKKLSN